MNQRHPIIKLIALAVAFVFFATSLGAGPDAWAAMPLTLNPNGLAGQPEISGFSKAFLAIPSELGQITDTVVGSPEAPSFIHIQSAHGNFQAEKNIEKLLGYIEENSSVKLMLLEGAAGKLHPEIFRIFPKHPDFNRKVTDTLMQEGYLTGPESFLINHDGATHNAQSATDEKKTLSALEAYGIEDLEAYKKDRESFMDVVKKEKTAEKFLGSLRASIDKRFSSQLNKNLLNLVRQEEAFGSGTISFEGWLKILEEGSKKHLKIDLSDAFYQDQFPFLIRYFRLRAISSGIDRDEALVEQAAFLKDLEKRGVSQEIINLFEPEGATHNAQSATEGKKTLSVEHRPLSMSEGYSPLRHAFDAAFEKLPKDFSMNAWPNWTLYAQHTILMQELESNGLQDEMVRLKENIQAALAKTPAEKEYLAQSRHLYLLRRLFSLELTRSEYEELKLRGTGNGKRETSNEIVQRSPFDVARGESNIGPTYKAALDFYALAVVRESHMFTNAVKRMSAAKENRAVIVTGGFHAEGLKKLAAFKNCSYVQITPRITEISDRDREVYLHAMLGSRDVETSQIAALLGLVDRAQRVFVTGRERTRTWLMKVRQSISKKISTEPLSRQPALEGAFNSFFGSAVPALARAEVRSEDHGEAARVRAEQIREAEHAFKVKPTHTHPVTGADAEAVNYWRTQGEEAFYKSIDQALEGRSEARTPGKKILVVDDDPTFRNFVADCLKDEGYKIKTAGNGLQALSLLKAAKLAGAPFDLLMTDGRMPEMDGPTLIKAAKPVYPEMKILLVSGGMEGMSEQQLAALGNGFLGKPFDIGDFLAAVETLLPRSETRSGDTEKSEFQKIPGDSEKTDEDRLNAIKVEIGRLKRILKDPRITPLTRWNAESALYEISKFQYFKYLASYHLTQFFLTGVFWGIVFYWICRGVFSLLRRALNPVNWHLHRTPAPETERHAVFEPVPPLDEELATKASFLEKMNDKAFAAYVASDLSFLLNSEERSRFEQMIEILCTLDSNRLFLNEYISAMDEVIRAVSNRQTAKFSEDESKFQREALYKVFLLPLITERSKYLTVNWSQKEILDTLSSVLAGWSRVFESDLLSAAQNPAVFTAAYFKVVIPRILKELPRKRPSENFIQWLSNPPELMDIMKAGVSVRLAGNPDDVIAALGLLNAAQQKQALSADEAKTGRSEIRIKSAAKAASKPAETQLTRQQTKQLQKAVRNLQPKWWDSLPFAAAGVEKRKTNAIKIFSNLGAPLASSTSKTYASSVLRTTLKNTPLKEWHLRGLIIEALGNLKDSAAGPELVAIFENEKEHQFARACAAQALDQLKFLSAIPALEAASKEKKGGDQYVIDAAVKARQSIQRFSDLGRSETRSANTRYEEYFQDVLKGLENRSPAIRRAAVETLVELDDPRSDFELRRALSREKDPGIHKTIREALELKWSPLTPEQEKRFQKALRDIRPQWWDSLPFVDAAVVYDRKTIAAEILAERKDPRAEAALLAALEDTKAQKGTAWYLRGRIVEALGNQSEGATLPLVEVLENKDKKETWETLYKTAQALGHLKDTDALEALREAAKNKLPLISFWARKAIISIETAERGKARELLRFRSETRSNPSQQREKAFRQALKALQPQWKDHFRFSNDVSKRRTGAIKDLLEYLVDPKKALEVLGAVVDSEEIDGKSTFVSRAAAQAINAINDYFKTKEQINVLFQNTDLKLLSGSKWLTSRADFESNAAGALDAIRRLAKKENILLSSNAKLESGIFLRSAEQPESFNFNGLLFHERTRTGKNNFLLIHFGMTPEQVDNFGERFFSARHYGAETTVEVMYADAELLFLEKENAVQITLKLPERGGESSAVRAEVRTPEASVQKRILVVDDEVNALKSYAMFFQMQGYAVETATDGKKALALLEAANRAGTPFDLLMTDRNMPNMDGGKLIGAAKPLYPAMKILVASSDNPEALGEAFLEKPVHLDALESKVSDLLSRSETRAKNPITALTAEKVGRIQEVLNRLLGSWEMKFRIVDNNLGPNGFKSIDRQSSSPTELPITYHFDVNPGALNLNALLQQIETLDTKILWQQNREEWRLFKKTLLQMYAPSTFTVQASEKTAISGNLLPGPISLRAEIRTAVDVAHKTVSMRWLGSPVYDSQIAPELFPEHASGAMLLSGAMARDSIETARQVIGIRTITASDVFVLGHEFFSQDFRLAAGMRTVYPGTPIVAIVNTAGERAFLKELNLRLAKEGQLPVMAVDAKNPGELRAYLQSMRGTVRATALLYGAETVPDALKHQLPNTRVVTQGMLGGFLNAIDSLVSELVRDLQTQFATAKSA